MCRYCEEPDIRRIVNEELDRRELEEKQQRDEFANPRMPGLFKFNLNVGAPRDIAPEIREIINEELDRREIEERKRSAEVSRRMQERIERFDVDRNEFVFLREKLPHEYTDWEPEPVEPVEPAEPAEPCTDGWIHDCEVDTKCDFVPAGFARCGYCGVERA